MVELQIQGFLMIRFLTLETFSRTGGVQMVCRSMAKALAEVSSSQDTFEMVSLCDKPADFSQRYLPEGLCRGFSYRRLAFVRYMLRKVWSTQIIILAHVNLISLAWMMKLLAPGIRIILLAHGKEVWPRLPHWKRSFMSREMEIWSVSRYTRMKLLEQHGIPPSRIKVLHNCLDPFFEVPNSFTKPSNLLERYNLNGTQKILLSICRMAHYERNKGYDLVLEVLPEIILQFPNLVYLLAGGTSTKEHARLTRKISDLDLESHVILTGFIKDEELPDHHLLADVFILPSSKEGFGLVFIEAAVCGTEIIAGNKDGSRDAVLDGRLGKLVNPTSRKEILSAIMQSLKAEYNESLAKERQSLALSVFSFEHYRSNINQLLKQKPTL